jgi:hypothetical protein
MKDPAILFYTSDFLTGTMTMTFEERGKFIYLLSTMHQHGRLSEETIRLLVGSISDNLKKKFRIDENGLWYNERLELESTKRAKFTESRRNNGNKGGRPKIIDITNNLMVNHKDNLMGNENENDNENRIKSKRKLKKPLSLSHLSIVNSSKTWYERHFQAYLENPQNQKRYKQSLDIFSAYLCRSIRYSI